MLWKDARPDAPEIPAGSDPRVGNSTSFNMVCEQLVAGMSDDDLVYISGEPVATKDHIEEVQERIEELEARVRELEDAVDE